jgi:sugar (pentulose or hexulose) kinase
MAEITRLAARSVRLVLPVDDITEHLYITGGFSRNPLFTAFLAFSFPGKRIFTSGVDNASSLGAAMVIHDKVFGQMTFPYDLRLKEVAG